MTRIAYCRFVLALTLAHGATTTQQYSLSFKRIIREALSLVAAFTSALTTSLSLSENDRPTRFLEDVQGLIIISWWIAGGVD